MRDFTERLGELVYREARMSTCWPPRGGAAEVARRMLGPRAVMRVAGMRADVSVCRVYDDTRIAIRSDVPVRQANFLVAVALASICLIGEPAYRAESVEERARIARAAGAWLVAPPGAIRARFDVQRLDVGAVADAFVVSETCAARRIAEVGGPACIVVTPQHIHRSGSFMSWIPDDEVRRLAEHRRLRSARRVRLYDEPGRVALFAKAS